MIYQFNPDMAPDACFEPGQLKHLVPGNEGRLLDARRTPLRVLGVEPTSGFFVVEILDFEDKGARWELPLEHVDRCQFALGSVEAGQADVALYAQIISRLDRPLQIAADPGHRAAAEADIAARRRGVAAWLDSESAFLASDASLDVSGQTASPALWSDLQRYMAAQGLWDIEEAFAEQYVSNPYSGELVKGHRIVLAELGLVPFDGRQVRKADLFAGAWSKQRRADHILHRLAFVRELFERLGHASVVLYRGFSCQGQPQAAKNNSFTSATFSLAVAMSHFTGRDAANTGLLLRQSIPIERLFMSFLETAAMNRRYQEAEAVLLYDSANQVF